MADAAQLGYFAGGQIELEQAQHLRIAILFDDVDALVRGDKVAHLAAEGIGAEAQVIRLDAVFLLELIAAFGDRKIRGAVGDDADLRLAGFDDERGRDEGARGFKLARETLHEVLVVLGALGVEGLFVMAAAAREVGGLGMVGARESAVGDRVAVDILIAAEASEAIQVFGAENFAAVEGLGRVFEGLGHPVVHAEVEIGEDEDGRLEALGKIESGAGKLEALFHVARQQDDVPCIAM